MVELTIFERQKTMSNGTSITPYYRSGNKMFLI